MRERVAAALQTTSPKGSTGPGSADDPDAHRGAVEARWPLLDVQTRPRRIPSRWFAAAFSDDTQVLSGKPDRFNSVVTSADVRAVAASVATVFLDPTKAFTSYASRS